MGSSVSGLGFHHQFLFQAYRVMTYYSPDLFQQRLENLRKWWLFNANDREMTVVFPVTSTGRLPPSKSLSIELKKWGDLPIEIQDAAIGSPEWQPRFEEKVRLNHSFLSITLAAQDPVNAAEKALELFANYYTVLRAASASVRHINIDDEVALVNDPSEYPQPKSYCVQLVKHRFRTRGRYDYNFAKELAEACDKSKDMLRFTDSYSMAVDLARAGKPRDALPHLARGIDLAFGEYIAKEKEEKKWGQPRRFVDKTSLLMSLDWCRVYYNYLLVYCLEKSFHMAGSSVIEARNPEKAFDIIRDDSEWNSKLLNCSWDELLNFRRYHLLQELEHLQHTIAEKRKQFRWDLARGVRARNLLFHQGLPLQDEYLLGVLLGAFDLILRLRMVAIKKGISFNELVHLAEDDYSKIVSGKLNPDIKSFSSLSWRRWLSSGGTDIVQRT